MAYIQWRYIDFLVLKNTINVHSFHFSDIQGRADKIAIKKLTFVNIDELFQIGACPNGYLGK
jgi:hypothetical protein